MNRSEGSKPPFSEPLPDEPWPVAARKLLTPREQSLYQDLVSLYPDHKLFVQVALSQLIDIDRKHPESESIRARYKQLAADFVLCRADLGVVAVIELDDRSHERRDRKDADARKSKALADAGLRLVRIPAGALPSEEKLRQIIDADGPSGDRTDTPNLHFVPPESDLRLADDWGSVQTHTPRVDHDRAASRALRAIALKMALGGVVIVGGWFVYSQLVPVVVQRALQPLVARHVPSSPPRSSSTWAPAQISPVLVVAGPTQLELAEKRRVESQAAAACEHPVDWKAQVECGDQYMRAKKDFESAWLEEHGTGASTAAAAVLDNGSIGGGPR